MKKIILSLAILGFVFMYASSTTINSETMLPTDHNATSLFKNTPPDKYKNTSNFIKIDSSGNKSQVESSTINTTSENMFGRIKPSADMYFGDPSKTDKYFKENSKSIINQGSGLANDIRNSASSKFTDKYGNPINNMDPNSFSKTAIKKNFEAESATVASQVFVDDIYKKVRAQMYVNHQIKCYITRKLNNSFMCPIENLNVATYGGGAKDSSEEAKKTCDDNCKIQTKCLPRFTNNPLVVTKIANSDLPIENFQMDTNPEQVTKYFTFDYETFNLNNVQKDYFTRDLVRSRITIVVLDNKGNYITLYDRYVYRIKQEGGSISLPIMRNVKKIYVYFYNSYIFDPHYINEIALYGDNPRVHIKNIAANYITNYRYFCPITQFVTDARQCNGKLLSVPIGGGYKTVCVRNVDKNMPNRSQEDGGYYFEKECDDACWDTRECVPTYRHLGNFTANVDPKYYDIQFGCVDSDDNLGCTEEKCKEYFEKSIQPSKELVWQKDDKIAITVNNGVETSIPRPKVDFTAEMSTNGGDKSELFSQEMKDSAYKYMIDNQTYNVTKVRMRDSIPAKMAADVKVNDITQQISFNLQYKPASDDVDVSKTLYIYPVMQLEIVSKPIEPISYNGRTYYPNELDRLRTKDISYLTLNQTTGQWIVFKRILNAQYYVPIQDIQTRVVEYKWVDTVGMAKTYFDKYDVASKKYLVYSPSETPSGVIHFVANSDKPWEDIMLFQSLKFLTEQEGVMFNTQNSKDGRVYDANIINNPYKGYYEGFRMYVLTSNTDSMSYGDLASKISDSNLIYDSKNLSKSKVTIEPDSTYADGRVQLFLLGRANNKSAFMKLVPDSTEVEKKGIIFMLLHE